MLSACVVRAETCSSWVIESLVQADAFGRVATVAKLGDTDDGGAVYMLKRLQKRDLILWHDGERERARAYLKGRSFVFEWGRIRTRLGHPHQN